MKILIWISRGRDVSGFLCLDLAGLACGWKVCTPMWIGGGVCFGVVLVVSGA